jgi:hypothetical protein
VGIEYGGMGRESQRQSDTILYRGHVELFRVLGALDLRYCAVYGVRFN